MLSLPVAEDKLSWDARVIAAEKENEWADRSAASSRVKSE